MEDFFQQYFDYVGLAHSEPPAVFHRWSAIAMIGSLLGRNCYLPFGHSRIYPNQYIMIMGSPGTRKSSAINIATGLMKKTGYDRFSSDKTSKERFLMDMISTPEDDDIEAIMNLTLEEPNEIFVAIGEFTDFIGQNNMEFVTMLTNLWDCPDSYKQPKIHGKSVEVDKPVVNILGGNTSQGFALAFPPEALGNGFLSRLLFIHGETTGKKITFPKAPDEDIEVAIVDKIEKIRQDIRGKIAMTKEAEKLCERIYTEVVEIEDSRFKHYNTRRFTHLLKLSMIMMASELRTTIETSDVLKANTVLVNAEHKMHKALGEFGKSKNSDLNNSILEVLSTAKHPMTSNEIFKRISQDVTKQTDLIEAIKTLQQAGKVQLVTVIGKTGYLPNQTRNKDWDTDLVLQGYLTTEELS